MMPKINSLKTALISTVHFAGGKVDAVRSFVYLTYRIPYIQKAQFTQKRKFSQYSLVARDMFYVNSQKKNPKT